MPITTDQRPTRLHMINAVLNGYKPQAERRLTDRHHLCTRGAVWSGQDKTFHAYDELDKGEPPKNDLVQVKAPDVLDDVSQAIGKLLDLQLTQDYANCSARADVVVDGQVIIADAPATYLLFLDKQLVLMRKFIDTLPTLDTAEEWKYDTQRRVWKSEPVKTISTRKTFKVLELVPPTDKHPGQAKPYEADEPRGEWTTIKLSGALQPSTVREYRHRLDKLLEAVKLAKEQANSIEVVDRRGAGEAVFSYLFR